MQLHVYIASASDGLFTVKTLKMPELIARAGTIDDIPQAVRLAAAALSGRPAEDFDVVIEF